MMTEEQKKEIIKFHLLPVDYRLVFRMVALFVSWYFNKSIIWGILHFFLGWIYIAYILLTGNFSDGNFGEIIKYYFY